MKMARYLQEGDYIDYHGLWLRVLNVWGDTGVRIEMWSPDGAFVTSYCNGEMLWRIREEEVCEIPL